MADLPDWLAGPADTAEAEPVFPSAVSPPSPPKVLPDWLQDDGSQALKTSLKYGAQIAPEQAAKVLNLKDSNPQLPTQFISRNADALQKQQTVQAVDPIQFQKDNPKVAGWLGEDPHHAALAGEDIPILGFLERQFGYLSQQAERGGFDVERSYLGMKAYLGLSGPEDERRRELIDKRLQVDLTKPPSGPITKLFGGMVESGPQLAGITGLTALAGTIGGPVAAGVATAGAFGAMETGNAYLDYRNRKDADGNPISDSEAKGWAAVSGVLNGAASLIPMHKLMDKIPGLRMLGKEGINSILESPTARSAFKEYIKQIGESGVTMGGFSGFGTLVHLAAGEMASMPKDATPSTILSRIFSKENLKAAGESTASGATLGMTLGGTLGAFDLYQRYGKVKEAINTQSSWQNVGTALQSMKMQEMAPQQVEHVIDRLAPDQHVYLPLDAWQTYWQGQKADPREVFKRIAGKADSYDDALRTGADLQIPASKYATTIAASDHGEFFNQHLRSEPLALNADEAQKAIKLEIVEADQKARENINQAISPQPEAPATPKEEVSMAFTKDPAERATLQAEYQQSARPLFEKLETVGMSNEQWSRYQRAIAEAGGTARKELQDDLIRKKERLYGKEREGLKEQFTQELNSDPRYRAASILRDGKMPDGSELPMQFESFPGDKFKLNTKAIQELKPGEPVAKIFQGMTHPNGVSPDLAAELLGFHSGDELIQKLTMLPDKESETNRMADEEMSRRHGDMTNPAVLGDIAMRAVHNQDRSKVLRMELEHLASNDFAAFKGLVRTIGRRIPTIQEVRDQAEDMIGSKTTAETMPSLYQRAESVASREAQEHFLRGDFEKAFEAKKQELLNHELYRAAQNERERTAKDMSYVQKFESDSVRARIGKAGSDYLEQIDALRERFDFGKASLKELGKRASLRDFVESQRQQGYEPDIPAELINEAYKTSWRQMTNNDLHSVIDSMRTIDHLSGLKDKLLASQAGRDYTQVKGDVTGSIQKNFDLEPADLEKKIDLHPDWKDKVGKNAASFGAWRTKMEFMFRFLDGGQYHGPAWETFFKPMNDAEDFKTARMRVSADQINEIFKDYSKSERAKFYSRLTHIPEIGMDMNKMDMLMTVLHWGNEGNRAELLRGYKWNESQVRAIWKNLEPRDFQTVQKIWDHINSYWPEISKQERELNGLTPEKIQSSPFDVTLKDGSAVHLEGGYFPLVYDKNISWRTAALGQDEMVKDLFATQGGRAATKRGWTNERVGGGGQAPSLNMSTWINHVSDVIHDLAYRKPVIDAYKLINDDDIRSHIEASAGKELYKQLNPWLKRIAGDRPWNPLGPLSALTSVRSNMTIAELGLKFTSAAIHSTSFLTASRELGPKYSLLGLKNSTDIRSAWDFVKEKSEFMRSRPDNFDRDVRATGRDLNIAGVSDSWLNELKQYSPIKRSAFWALMRGFDMGVAIPTWQGAYQRAMDGLVKNIEAGHEPDAIDYADQLVRDTKGSGAAKDLAPIQSAGGELGKLFTMFYTQLNVIDNQFMMASREQRAGFKTLPQTLATAGMVWFLQAPMVELLRGKTPGDDEGWGKWFAKAELLYPANMIPGLREAVSYWQRGDLEASPVFEAIKTMLKTAKNVGQITPGLKELAGEKDEWSDKDYSDALTSVGYSAGIPTRQAIRTTQYLYDWMTGAEQPENPMEGIWRLAVGRKAREK